VKYSCPATYGKPSDARSGGSGPSPGLARIISEPFVSPHSPDPSRPSSHRRCPASFRIRPCNFPRVQNLPLSSIFLSPPPPQPSPPSPRDPHLLTTPVSTHSRVGPHIVAGDPASLPRRPRSAPAMTTSPPVPPPAEVSVHEGADTPPFVPALLVAWALAAASSRARRGRSVWGRGGSRCPRSPGLVSGSGFWLGVWGWSSPAPAHGVLGYGVLVACFRFGGMDLICAS
jgi:hypothetical protein